MIEGLGPSGTAGTFDGPTKNQFDVDSLLSDQGAQFEWMSLDMTGKQAHLLLLGYRDEICGLVYQTKQIRKLFLKSSTCPRI